MFLTPLVLMAGPGPDLWTIQAPLVWSSTTYGTLTVPDGFITDLASIPRFFRNLSDYDPNGVSRRPAALHDWLYGSVEGRGHGKAFADCLLEDALLSEGAHRWVARTYYLAVHWFGCMSWIEDGRLSESRGPVPPGSSSSSAA